VPFGHAATNGRALGEAIDRELSSQAES
jgi:hypothetical protein